MKKNVQSRLPIMTIEKKTLKEKIEHTEKIGLSNLYATYEKAINKELEMRLKPLIIPEVLYDCDFFYNAAMTILEIAENATILRCCAKNGHVSEEKIAYESASAHANLASEIVDTVLDAIYGWGVDTPRHTRYEFTKLMRYHDLAENETGDGEDNLTRNENDKNRQEDTYFNEFAKFHENKHGLEYFHVSELFQEMRDLSTEDGRIAYLGDKLAAIVMVLCYKRLGIHMYSLKNDPSVSPVNLEEMKICDETYNDGYYMHEMWTGDFLFARELTRLDDRGYFTGLLVMITLICRDNHWYKWRLAQQVL